MTFKELRNQVGLTQVQIAEMMYVPVRTIQKWEKGDAIPSITYMNALSDILKVSMKEILNIFEPKETKVNRDNKYENELAEDLEKLFWMTSDLDIFFLITSLFALGCGRGVVYNDRGIFPFSIVKSGSVGISNAMILMDGNKNRVVLTRRNVIRVKPFTAIFDVFTFEITINCPIFPIDEKYNSNIFEQTFRVSFFNRDGR